MSPFSRKFPTKRISNGRKPRGFASFFLSIYAPWKLYHNVFNQCSIIMVIVAYMWVQKSYGFFCFLEKKSSPQRFSFKIINGSKSFVSFCRYLGIIKLIFEFCSSNFLTTISFVGWLYKSQFLYFWTRVLENNQPNLKIVYYT